MTETPETFPDPEMSRTVPVAGVERPKKYTEMTQLENNNIYEAIHQKLRKKYVYENNMHNI